MGSIPRVRRIRCKNANQSQEERGLNNGDLNKKNLDQEDQEQWVSNSRTKRTK